MGSQRVRHDWVTEHSTHIYVCGGVEVSLTTPESWESFYEPTLRMALEISHWIITRNFLVNGEGNGNPLQSSCLGNPRDRGAWQGRVHGVTKSQTRLSDWAQHTYICVWRCGGECNHSWILGVLLWANFEDGPGDLWLNNTRNFLVVQWLGLSTFTVWALVRS